MLDTTRTPDHFGADPWADTELASTHTPSILPTTFPDPEVLNRARQRRIARRAEVESAAYAARQRQAADVANAYQNGRDAGLHEGHESGWKGGVAWGIVCGVVATALVGGMAAWLTSSPAALQPITSAAVE